jgi:hypothetical protein
VARLCVALRRCGAMEEQMPLHRAAAVSDVATIRRLVEGADVNVQDAGGAGETTNSARPLDPLRGIQRACGCGTSVGGARR